MNKEHKKTTLTPNEKKLLIKGFEANLDFIDDFREICFTNGVQGSQSLFFYKFIYGLKSRISGKNYKGAWLDLSYVAEGCCDSSEKLDLYKQTFFMLCEQLRESPEEICAMDTDSIEMIGGPLIELLNDAGMHRAAKAVIKFVNSLFEKHGVVGSLKSETLLNLQKKYLSSAKGCRTN